ncbi:MAG: hypothetical protein OXL41_00725 [Nitrospinae bacterium]|nr:hypothetical protein [Nitrospinota bacterium]
MYTKLSSEGPVRRAWAASGTLRAYGAAVLAVCAVAIGLPPATANATAGKDYRLSGPYSRENLAIYLIHREGRKGGSTPIILGEAMRKGLVKVVETGNVRRLMVRNMGDREVFIQAGDIVKGGKQDRVLLTSMVIPPNSEFLPIGAFCVEAGRWAGRGREKVGEFSTSAYRMPSRAGKIAIMKSIRRERAPETRQSARLGYELHGLRILEGARRRSRGPYLQGEVWHSVALMQDALGRAVRAQVADRRSRTSLQLSLENKRLASALAGYEKDLSGLLEKHPDAVGYVFAVNGEINSGDEFGSAGLFRKVWSRQLKAAATEAIAGKSAPKRRRPTLAEVAAFIDSARAAKPASRALPGDMSLVTRKAEGSFYMEVRRGNDHWVHRNFVAR